MILLQIDWNPSPEIFKIGSFAIRYYSLMFVFAFMLGLHLMKKIFINDKIPIEKLDSLFIYMVVAILLGARIGHFLFYDPEFLIKKPLEVFLPFQFSPTFKFTGFAGLASHGAAIGAIISMYLYSKKVLKKPILYNLDRIVIPSALGAMFVRLGNLMNSEIIGKATNSDYGFVFKRLGEDFSRHPAQLYEAISYLAVFVILYFEKGIQQNKNNPEAYVYYANYLKDIKKNYKQSESLYLKAIEKDLNFIGAYNGLVDLYKEQKQNEKSIELLNLAIKNQPDIPDFYNLLGQVYFNKSSYSEAIESYKKASLIDSTFTKNFKNLGYSQIENNQIENAKSNLLNASKADAFGETQKEISEYLIIKAKNAMTLGTPKQAYDFYKLAFEIDKSSKTAQIYANYLYLQNASQKAIDIALPAISKKNTKALNIDLLKVLVKASIDKKDIKNTDYYYKLLTGIEAIPDFLLTSVYLAFKGDTANASIYRRKVNPKSLRSNKLKDLFSSSSINTYIIN